MISLRGNKKRIHDSDDEEVDAEDSEDDTKEEDAEGDAKEEDAEGDDVGDVIKVDMGVDFDDLQQASVSVKILIDANPEGDEHPEGES